MLNSAEVADRIKLRAKHLNVSVSKMLKDIGLSFNMMSNMKTSMPKADNLSRIADFLNCSVDYLLGRTDEPALNSGDSLHLDEDTAELVQVFEQLDRSGRRQLLGRAYELKDAQAQKNSSPRASGAKGA